MGECICESCASANALALVRRSSRQNKPRLRHDMSTRSYGSRLSSIESSNDFDSRDSLKEFDQLFEQSARPNGSPRSSDRDSDTSGSKVSSEQSDSARSNGSRRSSMETSQDLDSRDSLKEFDHLFA